LSAAVTARRSKEAPEQWQVKLDEKDEALNKKRKAFDKQREELAKRKRPRAHDLSVSLAHESTSRISPVDHVPEVRSTPNRTPLLMM
jgi:hypothetical protein